MQSAATKGEAVTQMRETVSQKSVSVTHLLFDVVFILYVCGKLEQQMTKKKVRISNSSLNCYGTRVLTSGVDLTQYKRNPVLLYMHRRGLVIGRMENIRVEGDDIVGEPFFDEVTPESQQYKKQWDAGTLKMVSANFDIIALSDDSNDLLPGQYRPTVTKSKLTEVSIVDIGGNDDAIVLTHEGKELKLAAGEQNDFLPLLDNSKNEGQMKDLKAIALALGLPETAEEKEILAAINLLLGYKTENEQLKKEKDQLQLSTITAAVQTAIDEHRITADKKDHFIQLGQSAGLESLKVTLSAIPVVKKPTDFINLAGGQAATTEYKKLSEVPADKVKELRENDRATYMKLYKAEYGMDCPNY